MARFFSRPAASHRLEPSLVAPAAQFGGSGADGGCQLGFAATIELGPQAGQSFEGTLSISLGTDGAIDSGSLQLSDGTSMPVVGQATGRSIRLRVGNDPNTVLTLIGSGVFPIDQCTDNLSGSFAGPGVPNVGVWIASASTGA